MTCKAHLDRSGQMVCVPCGLQWDADDPDPPECATEANVEIHKNVGREYLKQIREDLKK